MNRLHQLFFILCLSTVCISPSVGFSQMVEEYTLKSSYIERFTRFVEWPDMTLVEGEISSPIIISVLGRNPFRNKLEIAFSDIKINARDVVIKYVTDIGDISDSHIVFVARSMQNNVDDIVRATHGKPVLTIGDTGGFAQAGIMMNLDSESEKLIFEINVETIRNSGLKIDSLLLNYAARKYSEEGSYERN